MGDTIDTTTPISVTTRRVIDTTTPFVSTTTKETETPTTPVIPTTTPEIETTTQSICKYKDFMYNPGDVIGIIVVKSGCYLMYCDSNSHLANKTVNCPPTTAPETEATSTTPASTTTPEDKTTTPYNTPDTTTPGDKSYINDSNQICTK